MKKIIALALSCLFAFSGLSCAQGTASGEAVSTDAADTVTSGDSAATYLFTDSCGRVVTLPKNIERIAPSGPLAQIVLYTLCPDKMVGWATAFSEEQRGYVPEKYATLPAFGNFYGDTLNLEAVMTAQPQVIFDIGEIKPGAKEDLDSIQERTGIPTVFVSMELANMAEAYQTLGTLTGETAQAQRIIDYIEKTLADTESGLQQISQDARKTVYYGQGEGLTAAVAGTVHADVIDRAGGINVAQVEMTMSGGMSEISMEQLLLWNPDVILFAPESIYSDVGSRAEWQTLSAIKNEQYFEIPAQPYNWMGRPPSVNRLIGIRWLSEVLYPEAFDYDMIKETQAFYQLFYHAALSEEQAKALLSDSIDQ